LLLNPTIALADYPEKSVRVIVPFPPGGVTNIAARVIGQKLSEQWKQQIIVETCLIVVIAAPIVRKTRDEALQE